MKKIAVGIFAFAFAAGALAAAEPATSPVKPDAAPAPAEKKEEKKENPLHLNAAKRAAAGIMLAKPTSATLTPEVSAYGRVLDVAPLIALVAELDAARASLAASENEFARTEKLHAADANASAQALETAAAAMKRDRVAVASARARLIAGWGLKLANAAEAGLNVDALEKGAALARVDLLPGDVPAADLKAARVGVLGGTEMFDAEVIGPAPTVDAQVQGAGFLVVVREHPLAVGAALRATLAAPGQPEAALVVPRSSVVYHQGSAWVYVLGEEDTFERKIVTTGRSVGDGVVVTGVEDGEQVVTTGAAQLLSAELQAGGAPDEG